MAHAAAGYLPAVDPIVQNDLGQIGQLVSLGEAQPEVEVLGPFELRAVTANLQQQMATGERGGVDQGVGPLQHLFDRCIGFWIRHALTDNSTFRTYYAYGSSDYRHVWVATKEGNLLFETAGVCDVICVHSCHEHAARKAETFLARSRDT